MMAAAPVMMAAAPAAVPVLMAAAPAAVPMMTSMPAYVPPTGQFTQMTLQAPGIIPVMPQ